MLPYQHCQKILDCYFDALYVSYIFDNFWYLSDIVQDRFHKITNSEELRQSLCYANVNFCDGM